MSRPAPGAAVPDLLVVGAGPAGLALAIRARQLGLSVSVLDRAPRPPVDKACGEGLMPDGLARLTELGVALPEGAAAPFRGIRYLDGDTVADGTFPGGPPGAGRGSGAGLGVRRTVLHQALADRAQVSGVELRWGVRATGLAAPSGAVGDPEQPGVSAGEGGVVRGRVLVGADGLRSAVRRWAGLEGASVSVPAGRPGSSGPSGASERGRRARERFGVRRHYRIAPWSDRVEVHWADRCEAYVTPVGPELVGVAMLWSGARASFDGLLARVPALARRLAGAPAASRDRGAGPFRQRPRGVVRGRIALVGDASGYLDAITGEGLSLAFHQAFALAEAARAVTAGEARDLRPYGRAHRRLRRLPEALIRLLLVAERRPGLRRRTVRALAGDPELFDRLLALHAGAVSPRELGPSGALALAGRLVRGLAAP
ncbi:MAG: NAD(P)/FAD-dependent oxidoreductase [Thermoanaerobaculia bacterium]